MKSDGDLEFPNKTSPMAFRAEWYSPAFVGHGSPTPAPGSTTTG